MPQLALILVMMLASARTGPIHLTKPWSQLSGLSAEQKQKLTEIHRHARAQIRELLQRERRDSLAVLNQAQLDQLRNIEEQKIVDRKLAATRATGDSEP